MTHSIALELGLLTWAIAGLMNAGLTGNGEKTESNRKIQTAQDAAKNAPTSQKHLASG
jgi:hypothetical protein